MEKQRKQGLLPIVFGTIFILLSVLLLIMTRNTSSLFLMVIAFVDLIFGVIMVSLGIHDLNSPAVEFGQAEAAAAAEKKGFSYTDTVYTARNVSYNIEERSFPNAQDDEFDDFDDDFGDTDEATFDDTDEAMFDDADEATTDIETLTQREIALRGEVRLANEDARIAAEDAAVAEKEYEEAQARIAEAQQEVRVTYGVEQQDALRKVHELTQQAADAKSQAMVAARKASVAARVAEQKKAEHRKAMTEAAAAMAEQDAFDDDF